MAVVLELPKPNFNSWNSTTYVSSRLPFLNSPKPLEQIKQPQTFKLHCVTLLTLSYLFICDICCLQVGERLARYDVEKQCAINKREYDLAKKKKEVMEDYRRSVYQQLEVYNLLDMAMVSLYFIYIDCK